MHGISCKNFNCVQKRCGVVVLYDNRSRFSSFYYIVTALFNVALLLFILIVKSPFLYFIASCSLVFVNCWQRVEKNEAFYRDFNLS